MLIFLHIDRVKRQEQTADFNGPCCFQSSHSSCGYLVMYQISTVSSFFNTYSNDTYQLNLNILRAK